MSSLKLIEELNALFVVPIDVNCGVFEVMFPLHLAVKFCSNAFSAMVLLDENGENPFMVSLVKIKKPPSNRMTLGGSGNDNVALFVFAMVFVIFPD